MEYIKIPGVDKPISPITLGCDSKPFRYGEDMSNLLDDICACGVTSFDTARGYARSESVIGRWMKSRGNRDEVVIISKCCLPLGYINRVKVKNIHKDVERSLLELQTSYIDILYLHRDCQKEDPVALLLEMNELIKEGKVRAIGVSNWTCKRIGIANEYAKEHGLVPFTVSSPAYSLAHFEKDPWRGSDGCISIQDNEEELEFYRTKEVALFPYSSLARGFFSGKFLHDDPAFKSSLDRPSRISYYSERNLKRLARAEELARQKGLTPASISIAYMHSQGFALSNVIATINPKRMEQNLQACEIKLSESEIEYLMS